MHTVNLLIRLVEHHQSLVYFIIFLGLIVEGDFILICTGILIHLRALDFGVTLFILLLGGMSKSLLGYYIGAMIHEKWHETKFLQFLERHIYTIMPHFKKKPYWSLFLSKFITGANQFLILFSGYHKVDFKKYLRVEAISTLIWVPGFMLIGFFFSYTAIRVSHEIYRFLLVVLCLLVLYIIIDRLVGWVYGVIEEFFDNA